MLFKGRQSQTRRRLPSAFLTKKTGAPYGDRDGSTHPCRSSCSNNIIASVIQPSRVARVGRVDEMGVWHQAEHQCYGPLSVGVEAYLEALSENKPCAC